ncbi:hypothetical protein SYNPS1DRAFT_15876, partial [Syncephalis pseudoplumigaleata]
GTPYLLSLGMRRSYMSLVWLAGPLSGLIMQPLVGAFSDRCTSRFGRRRPFMLGGTVVVIFGLMLIGWVREIGGALAANDEQAATLSIAIAVAAFYLVDFAVNTVQATIRALIVDVLPGDKQEQGNAWAGGMIGVGSVGGYFFGMMDLVSAFPYFGNTQMKVLCTFASMALFSAVSITCLTTHERSFDAPLTIANRPSSSSSPPSSRMALFNPCAITRQLIRTMHQLPSSIQRICNVQFFAWIGWFPFLFYATTWVAELKSSADLQQQQQHIDGDTVRDTVGATTRAGSFAFLLHSLVSLVTACLLPLTVATGQGRASTSTSAKHHPLGKLRWSFGQWFDLHRIYTLSHLLFGTAMLATLFASAVWFATLLIAVCGISWAIIMWAPFALIGEIVNRDADIVRPMDDEDVVIPSAHPPLPPPPTSVSMPSLTASQQAEYHPLADTHHAATATSSFSSPTRHHHASDTTSVIGLPPLSLHANESSHEDDDEYDEDDDEDRMIGLTLDGRRLSDCAGEILGIHNVYVVIPQFVSTFASSILFALFDHFAPPAAIGWILRLGGISVLWAAYLSTKIRTA